MVILNDDNYKEVVSNSNKLIVVDFYADWCGPCKALSPTLERVEGKNPDVIFAKIDVDNSPECAALHGIRSIPTVIFLKNGEVVNKFMGNHQEDFIQTTIDDLNK
jgi:thioredoxin 1